MSYSLRCRVCESVTASAPVDSCVRCEGPTDVSYDWGILSAAVSRAGIEVGPPSMWRYAALLPTSIEVGAGPGWTPLVRAERLSQLLDVDLRLKLETANPTHSFKDRIAAVARTAAVEHGIATLACASTGNLGDAVAAEAAAAGLEAIVLAPTGDAAVGAIARACGARVIAVDGSYDDCRRLELELGGLFPWGFLEGNLFPYASEGAKTISYEIAEQLDWELPDAVICPAASGALFSKIAQGFTELGLAGLADDPLPRLYAAQAGGCGPIASAYADDRSISRVRPRTRVHSLAVGNPVFGDLAIGAARASGGSIISVPEEEIDAHTEFLARMTGVVPDCAGGVAIAALLQAVDNDLVEPGSRVVLVVTGTGMKPHGHHGRDGYDARPELAPVAPTVDAILSRLGVD